MIWKGSTFCWRLTVEEQEKQWLAQEEQRLTEEAKKQQKRLANEEQTRQKKLAAAEEQVKQALIDGTSLEYSPLPQIKKVQVNVTPSPPKLEQSCCIKNLSEPSLDLSDFYSNSFGRVATTDPSNVSVSSEENVDGDAAMKYSYPQPKALQSKPTEPKPLTVLDFAKAAAAKSNKPLPVPKEEKVIVYLECPLDFFSRVCDSSSVQYSSVRDTTKSLYQRFDATDDKEKVYPMNFVEDESTAFMLCYKSFPPIVQPKLSGTELLLRAAASQEKNVIQKKCGTKPTKKRKTLDFESEPISIQLGDLIKKRRVSSSSEEESQQAQEAEASVVNNEITDPSALQAFLLADQALKDTKIWKQLLFSMTISRDFKRPPQGVHEPGPGTVLEKAFLWSTYPTLERVLIDNMREYYEFSIGKCMTKEQLDFNNRLLVLVKQCAADQGWRWGEGYNTDKKIRNRVRCYYKVSFVVDMYLPRNTIAS
jgi:hypothetical protein